MRTAKTECLLVGLLCLAIETACAGATWEMHATSGVKAFQQGDYTEAEKQYTAALRKAEEFGSQDPRLATSLSNLALLYEAQGRYAEAEPLHQRALATRERALGPEHPYVATSLNNLAELYRVQGRYAEAEPLFKRALAIWEKAPGPEHPHVATSLENYAALLRQTGRNAEADRVDARAKRIRAKRTKENPSN
jgi:tetratricopeptide (TPR) repeat protein